MVVNDADEGRKRRESAVSHHKEDRPNSTRGILRFSRRSLVAGEAFSFEETVPAGPKIQFEPPSLDDVKDEDKTCLWLKTICSSFGDCFSRLCCGFCVDAKSSGTDDDRLQRHDSSTSSTEGSSSVPAAEATDVPTAGKHRDLEAANDDDDDDMERVLGGCCFGICCRNTDTAAAANAAAERHVQELERQAASARPEDSSANSSVMKYIAGVSPVMRERLEARTAKVQFKKDSSITKRACRLEKRLPILIRVIDQGPGVSKKNSKKLFQPFQQVNAAADKKQGGTGLGLALVRYLAREHKGIAWLEWSREGVGSCFSLLLPLVQAADMPEDEDTANAMKQPEHLFGARRQESTVKRAARGSSADGAYNKMGISQVDASVYGLKSAKRRTGSVDSKASSAGFGPGSASTAAGGALGQTDNMDRRLEGVSRVIVVDRTGRGQGPLTESSRQLKERRSSSGTGAAATDGSGGSGSELQGA